MGNYLLILECLLYYICLYTVLKNLYGYSRTNKKISMYVVILHISMMAIAIIVKFDASVFSFLLLNIFNFISLKLSFVKCKNSSILLPYIILYSINIMLSAIVTFILNKTLEIKAMQFIGFALNFIVLILCIFLLHKRKTYLQLLLQTTPKSAKLFAMFSILSSTIVLESLLIYGLLISVQNWNLSQKLFVSISILIIGSIFPVLIIASSGKEYYSRQSKMFEEHFERQVEHYKEQEEKNLELRRFKHDYKNMLIGVSKLISEGNIGEALNLLNKENETMNADNLGNNFDTGNGIVDAILAEKQKKANLSNTQIVFDGSIPADKISPTDLCIIFGNTLDNAIEACEKIQDSEKINIISILCKATCDYIFVNISNPVSTDTSFDPINIQSTKEDKLNHGFGLYSLKKSVEQYNGQVKYDYNNEIFTVDLEFDFSA